MTIPVTTMSRSCLPLKMLNAAPVFSAYVKCKTPSKIGNVLIFCRFSTARYFVMRSKTNIPKIIIRLYIGFPLRRHLEFRIFWRPRERKHVPYIAHSCYIHYYTLKSQSVSSMLCTAILPELFVPPVVILVQIHFSYSSFENIVSLFPLASANYLSDTRNKEIHCRNGVFVIVQPHVEGFYVFGIISYKDRLFEYFFCQVPFVLCL